MLLAAACNTQNSVAWPDAYRQLMLGLQGENIQAKQGIKLIDRLADALRYQEKPVHLNLEDRQLVIDNFANFIEVISDSCCVD